nr:MAG: nonstructural protein [Microviridae sp.]
MSKKLYSIRDIKSTSYLPCFNAQNHADATRQVQHNAKDSHTVLGEFPEDFEVFYIGEFDEQSGKLTGLQNPEFLTSVKALTELSKGNLNG